MPYSEAQTITISSWSVLALCLASLLFFILGWFVALAWRRKGLKRLSGQKRSVYFSLLMLASTWCVRYLVGISGIPVDESLTWFEEIGNSFLHALQSFSLDEAYTQYLANGKEVFRQAFQNSGAWPDAFGVYITALNLICPISGGALLAVLAASLFPRLRLWWNRLFFWRTMIYFSELNPASLALAKSIRTSSDKLCKATLVFTDTYPDSDDESVSEQIQEAKALGAICLKDDLSLIPLQRKKKQLFFLMDEKSISNLQQLSEFAEEKRATKLCKENDIYYFCNDDSNTLVEKSVREALEYHLGADEVPALIPVREYQNLVFSLLREKPLFTALDQAGKKDLHVTILGSGNIGTEAFLDTIWCGQLLDRKLEITVISKEPKQDFLARINCINPDILLSGVLVGEPNHEPNTNLLKIYKDGRKHADPYFAFTYIEADVCRDDLQTILCRKPEQGSCIVDSDYYLVALGSDKDNLEAANRLARCVTVNAGANRKPPIVAYAIFDDALNQRLMDQAEKMEEARMKGTPEYCVEFYPFGSLSQTYSYNNVMLQNLQEQSASVRSSYETVVSEKTADRETVLAGMRKDQYAFCADTARVIHIPYKAFCVGMDADSYVAKVREEKNLPGEKRSSVNLINNYRLAWLEHRRWIAFLRTRGFRCPTPEQENMYIGWLPVNPEGKNINKGKHKNLSLKLHPCMVECAQDPAEGKNDLLSCMEARFFDNYQDKFPGGFEFKKYDYPEYDA